MKYVYVDPALPFGVRSAPKIFTVMADVLQWKNEYQECFIAWMISYCLELQASMRV